MMSYRFLQPYWFVLPTMFPLKMAGVENHIDLKARDTELESL